MNTWIKACHDIEGNKYYKELVGMIGWNSRIFGPEKQTSFEKETQSQI